MGKQILSKNEIKELRKTIMVKEVSPELTEAKALLRNATTILHRSTVRSKLIEKDCWEMKQIICAFLDEEINKKSEKP